MSGPDPAINVLKPFTLEKSAWTVEIAATALKVSVSSAYRYVQQRLPLRRGSRRR